MEAGAKGGYFRSGQEVGPDGPWEPVFDDPVFLAKLDKFLAAFAARYDRQAVAALRGHRQHRRLGRRPHLGRQPQELSASRCGNCTWIFTSSTSNAPSSSSPMTSFTRLKDPAERADAASAHSDQRHQLPRRQHHGERIFRGHERPLHRAQPGVLRRRLSADPNGVRAGTLRNSEDSSATGKPVPTRPSPSSAKARKARTSSAARSNSCTRPTSATTAMRASG